MRWNNYSKKLRRKRRDESARRRRLDAEAWERLRLSILHSCADGVNRWLDDEVYIQDRFSVDYGSSESKAAGTIVDAATGKVIRTLTDEEIRVPFELSEPYDDQNQP